MLDHIGFDCSDYRPLRAFYEQALAPLGLTVVMEITKERFGGHEGCGFGEAGKTEFWIGSPTGPGSQPVPRSLPVAFRAADPRAVGTFHAAALAAGGEDNGGPGIRAHYHQKCYAASVLDPDGHNVEAVCPRPDPA